MDKHEDNKALQLGAAVVSGAAGATIGLCLGGVPGAIVGNAIAPVFQKLFQSVGNDILERMLSPREKEKIGSVHSFVIAKIQSNLDNHNTLRTDGFFESQNFDRSAAEEIYEGVLLAAQREYEEKKIKYYANLLANLSCEKSKQFGRSEANALLKAGESLTYNELCILAVIGAKQLNQIGLIDLRQADYRQEQRIESNLGILLHQIYGLYRQGMISFGGTAALGLKDVFPAKMAIQGVGAHLFNLMELFEIPKDDYAEMLRLLQ